MAFYAFLNFHNRVLRLKVLIYTVFLAFSIFDVVIIEERLTVVVKSIFLKQIILNDDKTMCSTKVTLRITTENNI